MARIRTIKPEFPQSESMGRVSRDARLLFVMLWTIADDSGRLRGNSRMLSSLLFPYDDDARGLIDGWLAELSSEGCVTVYKVGGDTYVQVCNWLNHQKIDKPSRSKIPPFDESSRILANPREVSSGDQRIKDQGSEDHGPKDNTRAPRLPDDRFDQFWLAYPRKVAKESAAKAWKKLSPDQPLFDEIMAGLVLAKASSGWTKDSGQFIPHPATWLNGRRWTDRHETGTTVGGNHAARTGGRESALDRARRENEEHRQRREGGGRTLEH